MPPVGRQIITKARVSYKLSGHHASAVTNNSRSNIFTNLIIFNSTIFAIEEFKPNSHSNCRKTIQVYVHLDDAD